MKAANKGWSRAVPLTHLESRPPAIVYPLLAVTQACLRYLQREKATAIKQILLSDDSILAVAATTVDPFWTWECTQTVLLAEAKIGWRLEVNRETKDITARPTNLFSSEWAYKTHFYRRN